MTSSSRVGDAPSLRLQTLKSYYQSQEHVWDIGCDHGLLGLSLVAMNSVKSIHLVDPSIKVIETLKTNLKGAYITKNKVFIHHKHGQELFIESKNNLIFIAGMGGKEIGDIIATLLPQLDSSTSFVISPHRKILELRSLLNKLPVSMITETVLLEGEQFYQIMHLGIKDGGVKVPLYGRELWGTETGEKYRLQQISAFKTHRDKASMAYLSELESLKPLILPPKEKT